MKIRDHSVSMVAYTGFIIIKGVRIYFFFISLRTFFLMASTLYMLRYVAVLTAYPKHIISATPAMTEITMIATVHSFDKPFFASLTLIRTKIVSL